MTGRAHRFEVSGDSLERLEGEHRREMIPVESALSRLSLRSVDSVLDLGAGVGYFSFPISRVSSSVVALDIEPKMISSLSERRLENGSDNLIVVRGDITSLPFEKGSFDKVLAAFVYHEVDSQERLIQECHRVLRPSGSLTVIDFQKWFTGGGPPFWVRRRPSHVLSVAKGMFRLTDRHDAKAYYQLRLEKI